MATANITAPPPNTPLRNTFWIQINGVWYQGTNSSTVEDDITTAFADVPLDSQASPGRPLNGHEIVPTIPMQPAHTSYPSFPSSSFAPWGNPWGATSQPAPGPIAGEAPTTFPSLPSEAPGPRESDAFLNTNPSNDGGVATKQRSIVFRERVRPPGQPPVDTDVDRPDEAGLFWSSSYAMFGYLCLAFLFMLAHHLWYYFHDGRFSGSARDQIGTRVLGNIFAWLVQSFLMVSMDIAYTQWLVRCLIKTEVATRVVNEAYRAPLTALALFSHQLELPRSLPSVATIALGISAVGMVTQVITPGTLNVVQRPVSSQKFVNVTQLNINSPSWNQSKLFQVSRSAYGSSPTSTQKLFLGPRSLISRLSAATAASGQLLFIPPPFVNSSYNVQFFGPYVQCNTSNDTVSFATQQALNQSAAIQTQLGLSQLYNAFFAYVPDLNVSWGQDNSRTLNSSKNSNELWVQYKNNGTSWITSPYPECPNTVSHQCRLYNASYDLAFTFQDGDMRVDHRNGAPKVFNAIEYPGGVVDTSNASVVPALAYSAVFWALSELLTGSMGLYTEAVTYVNGTTGTAPIAAILSPLENTALLGSADLDCFFGLNWYFNGTYTWSPPSPQRALDIAFARNETLDVLIAELSANITISLMSGPFLTLSAPTMVNVTSLLPQYSFQSTILWSTYGSELAAVFIVNVVGLLAFRHNGFRIDRSFTSIVWVIQHNGLFDCLSDAYHQSRRLSIPDVKRSMVKIDLTNVRSSSDRRKSEG